MKYSKVKLVRVKSTNYKHTIISVMSVIFIMVQTYVGIISSVTRNYYKKSGFTTVSVRKKAN